jgi:probable HAF family extracellular repeat protein
MKRSIPVSLCCFVLSLVSLALVPLPVSGAPADPPYTVTDLGGLASDGAYPTAINANGDVVGVSSMICGPYRQSCTRAFLYSSSTGLMSPLGVIGDGSAPYSNWAYGINASRDAVGSTPEELPASSSMHRAALYHAGGDTELLPPPDPSVALAINDSGLIVGYGVPAPFGPTRAFLYDPAASSLTDIQADLPGATASEATAVNAGGDVVGSFDSPGQSKHAFLRHPGGAVAILTPPGGLDTDVEARGVNASGQVVGATNLRSGSPPFMAILWSEGTARDLGTLNPTVPGAAALGINHRGDVVGSSSVGFRCLGGDLGPCNTAWHAFLYSDGQMRDLNELIPPDSGWVLETATAINDAGQIVAAGRYLSTSIGGVLLTPSPGSMVESLIELVRGFDLPKGTENSLVTKVEHAQAALAAGDTGTACSLLGAFVNETRAQAGKKLTAEQAARMISSAEQIRAAMGCS